MCSRRLLFRVTWNDSVATDDDRKSSAIIFISVVCRLCTLGDSGRLVSTRRLSDICIPHERPPTNLSFAVLASTIKRSSKLEYKQRRPIVAKCNTS